MNGDDTARFRDPAFVVLLGAVFTMPFSFPVSRVLLAIATSAVLVRGIRESRLPTVPAVAWCAAFFVALTCVVTLNGVHPALGVPKLRKLLWFVAIPVAAAVVTSRRRLWDVLTAWALGGAVLAVYVLVHNPLEAHAAWRAGSFATFGAALIDAGSMTNGQRLVLALVAALAVAVRRRGGRRRDGWAAVAVMLVVAALVLNLKRGSWLSACAVVGLLVVVRTGWKGAVLAVGVVLLALSLPFVRIRLAALRTEFEDPHGGRMTMWTQVAPALVRRYPWGVGFRSLTNDMMREIAPDVEPGRDHLHGNIPQVLVATGWCGLGAYVLWMLCALRDAWRFLRGTAGRDPPEHLAALALALMLVALLLNGLVEYNLADAELVLGYGFLMGSLAAGARRHGDALTAGAS